MATAATAEDYLDVLQIEKYYPQKLGYAEAIRVRRRTEDDQEYGIMIIRKLLEMDHKALYTATTKINNNIKSQRENESKKSTVKDEVIAMKNLKIFSFLDDETDMNVSKIHPMDLMLAVFTCCDTFLRQMLVEKMFTCRLAIPILLPSYRNGTQIMLLWGLNTIFLETKGTTEKKFSQPLVDIPNPIVSFLRVGNLHRSKSKLLNMILNEPEHHTFYHRDCLNGPARRLKSNGIIEAAWFISDGNFDTHSEFFTVLNLRGNSLDLTKQTRFMCEQSSLLVIMVDSLDSFKTFHDRAVNEKFNFKRTRIILAFVSTGSLTVEDWKQYIVNCVLFEHIDGVVSDRTLQGREMNQDEWKTSIRNSVREFMEKTDKRERLLRSVIANSRFSCDCNGESWEKAKKQADEFVDLVKQEASKRPQKSWCPLQGEPWMRLGELERKQRRRISKEEGNRQEITADIAAEIKKCREEQVEFIRQLSKPIFKFCEGVYILTDISRQCFLKLTKINLDIISREIIPGLNEKQSLPGSIGLEHIMREMGQMFEAAQTYSDHLNSGELIHSKAICWYPEIVATLLLEGIPLEIMDGDACNVALKWLSAVFSEIEKQIGKDKKVFVLSIIGVQSSGKSTFLNALFGLQFPVSAGRCTKGIYCHLVPMHAATISPGCDYILIIDSEGLRAPEYAGKSTFRDNELATLAIGLADLTIVNVKGESFSDMEDILQIVVHALIRIRHTKKDLKLMPSCFFVHQNVPAADAEKKTETGKKNQLRFLDEMARKAAQNEDENYVSGFSDVIQHDENLHSWYMPDLWSGRPPMATVNINYSEGVSEVKEGILKMILKKQVSLTISNFFWRISDLWNALLHNNFVLCFRNTGEILAHRGLDTQITNIFCDLKNQNREEQTIISNRIISCDCMEDLTKFKDGILKEHEQMLDNNIKKARNRLHEILKDGEYKNVLEDSRTHYKQGFEKRTDDERNRCLNETIRFIKTHLVKLKNLTSIRVCEKKLLKAVREESEKQRSMMMPDSEPEETFERIFNKHTSALNAQLKTYLEEGTNFVKAATKEALENTLSELSAYSSSSKLDLDSFLTQPPLELPSVTDVDIEMEAFKESSLKAVHQKSYVTEANIKCRAFFRHVKSQINSKAETQKVCYNKTFVTDIIGEVGIFFGMKVTEQDTLYGDESVIEGHSNACATTLGYKFKIHFVKRFLIFIGQYVFERLNELTRDYIFKTEPFMDILNRYKPQLKMVFQNKTPAEILANILVNMAKEAVSKDLGRIALEKINVSEDKTFESKNSFLNKILTDLANEENFPDYIAYLENMETYFEKKITMLLKDTFTKQWSNYGKSSLIFEVTIYTLNHLLDEIMSCLIKGRDKCNSAEEFLTTIQESLQKKLLFQKNDYRLILDLGIDQLEHFTKTVLENVEIVKNETITSYLKTDEDLWNELKKNEIDLVEELLKKISGCPEKCPFCSAPCLRTIKDHYPADCHRAYHYPMGVAGTVNVKSLFGASNQDTSVTKKSKSNTLVLETCDILVDSKKEFRSPATIQKYRKWFQRVLNWNYYPYSKYKKIYPEWEIKLDRTMEASLYWKWFMVKFHKNLEEHYKAKVTDIPKAWKDITKEQALKSLEIPV